MLQLTNSYHQSTPKPTLNRTSMERKHKPTPNLKYNSENNPNNNTNSTIQPKIYYTYTAPK